MALRSFRGQSPRIHDTCFVESSAQIIGDVTLEEGASIWFNAVVRGDVNPIRVGPRSNIQDLCLIHVLSDRYSTSVGEDVTVGHHVVLHGCTVGNRVLVGVGAIVLDGVEIGDDCIIAAGAVLTPGTHVPAGSLVMGMPGRVNRLLNEGEKASVLQSAKRYVTLAEEYRLSHRGLSHGA